MKCIGSKVMIIITHTHIANGRLFKEGERVAVETFGPNWYRIAPELHQSHGTLIATNKSRPVGPED